MKFKSFFLYFIIIFTLIFSGCGSSAGSSADVVINPEDNQINTDYNVIGQISDSTVNYSPLKSVKKISPDSIMINKSVYIGYFDKEGTFISIPASDSVVDTNGSYKIRNISLPEEENKNLVIKVCIDENIQWMNIISCMDKGTTEVETITQYSGYKAEIVRSAAKLGMSQKINVASMVSKMELYKNPEIFYTTSSNINGSPLKAITLSQDEIDLLTAAFLSYEDEMFIMGEKLGFTTQELEALDDYGHILSQQIVSDIENGKYITQDEAWRTYEMELRNWAIDEGYDQENVELLFLLKDLEYRNMIKRLRKNVVKVIDENKVRTSLEYDQSVISDFLYENINDSEALGRATFFINELNILRSKLEKANSDFGAGLNIRNLLNSIDSFSSNLQSMRFSNMDEVNSYFDTVGYDIKKISANKYGELLLYAIDYDFNKLATLYLKLGESYSDFNNAIITSLEGNPVYAYHTYIENFNPMLDINKLIEYYLENDPEIAAAKKAKNINIMMNAFKNSFISEFKSMLSEENLGFDIGWNNTKKTDMAHLYLRTLSLGIPQPMSLMLPLGESRTIFGRLRKLLGYEKPRIYGESFSYAIVDPISGNTMAYARNWTETDESTRMSFILNNGMEDTIFYTENFDGPIDGFYPASDESWFDDYLKTNSGTYAINYYFAGVPVTCFPAVTLNDINKLYINKTLIFEGYVRPPEGTWNSEGTAVIDIAKYDSEPVPFVITSAQESTGFNFGNKIGKSADYIPGCVKFNSSLNKYLVGNTSYFKETTDFPLSPEPESSSAKNIYWILDFSQAKIISKDRYDDYVFTDSWNPDTYDIENTLYRFSGYIKEMPDLETKDSIFKIYSVNMVEEYATESDISLNFRENFYTYGILGNQVVKKGNRTYDILDINDLDITIAKLYLPSQYKSSNISNWLKSNKNKSVIIGDKDPSNDFDGITLSLDNIVWDDSLNLWKIVIDQELASSTDWVAEY